MFEKAFCVRRRKCCLSCGCGGYFAQLPSHTALSSAPSRPPTTLGSTLALCESPPQPCLGKQRRPPSRTLLVAPRPRPLLARKHGAQQKSADNTVSHTALALLSLLLQALWHSGHALNGRSRRTTHTTATLTPTPTSDAICYYSRDFAARTRKPSVATVTTTATATTTATECPTVTATMNSLLLQQAHRMSRPAPLATSTTTGTTTTKTTRPPTATTRALPLRMQVQPRMQRCSRSCRRRLQRRGHLQAPLPMNWALLEVHVISLRRAVAGSRPPWLR